MKAFTETQNEKSKKTIMILRDHNASETEELKDKARQALWICVGEYFLYVNFLLLRKVISPNRQNKLLKEIH